jgi:hypothetical protein
MLLADELSIAQPGYVLGFGNDVRWAVGQLRGFKAGRERAGLHTGSIAFQGGDAEALLLYHPV